jgi:hypothetical protein
MAKEPMKHNMAYEPIGAFKYPDDLPAAIAAFIVIVLLAIVFVYAWIWA